MITPEQIALFLMVITRVSAFIAFYPLFSQKQLPSLVKAGMACALSIFWTIQLHNSDAFSIELTRLHSSNMYGILMIAREATIGVIMAIAMGAFFWPAKIAGSYVGQEMGLSMASISDPGSQDSSTLLSRIFETLAILLFFALNIHHFVILVINHSFAYSSGLHHPTRLPTEQYLVLLTSTNDRGLLIVAPLLIGALLVTLAVVFLTRAAPTLNLFSIGMPIRVGLGIFCLLIFSPVIFASIQSYFYRSMEDIEMLLRH